MSWEEALRAMLDGKVVQNRHFTSEEWFHMRDGVIFAEDGCCMQGWFTGESWQMVGWSVKGEVAA